VLVDSNTSLRILQPQHPQHTTALEAVRILARRGEELCIVPQNLVEVWAVATRPATTHNGLGMNTEQAAAALQRLKDLFTVLADNDKTYDAWEVLVIKHRVSGKATHDARIVAAMQVHGLTSILTFDKGDFARFTDIEVVHPADVTAPAS
jgi:predicted nucleic acid-binding protein